MNKQQVYREMEEQLGVTPTFFKQIPEPTLEQEWQLFQYMEMQKGPIPQKYRQLIGLGVSAAIKCRYCLFFHTEMAKLHGATEAEIADTLYVAKFTTGWSTQITGSQTDIDQYKREVSQACKHVKESQLAKV